MLKYFVLFILLYLFNINLGFTKQLSDGTTNNLANQCFKSHEYNAKNYGRTLNKKYSNKKAYNLEYEISDYKIFAVSSITIKDNYNEEFDVNCFFNSNAYVFCFSDPYNLKNKENSQQVECWNKPVRF